MPFSFKRLATVSANVATAPLSSAWFTCSLMSITIATCCRWGTWYPTSLTGPEAQPRTATATAEPKDLPSISAPDDTRSECAATRKCQAQNAHTGTPAWMELLGRSRSGRRWCRLRREHFADAFDCVLDRTQVGRAGEDEQCREVARADDAPIVRHRVEVGDDRLPPAVTELSAEQELAAVPVRAQP